MNFFCNFRGVKASNWVLRINLFGVGLDFFDDTSFSDDGLDRVREARSGLGFVKRTVAL